jgi:hypothetical protein
MVRYLFELDQAAILHVECANCMPWNEESLNLNLKNIGGDVLAKNNQVLAGCVTFLVTTHTMLSK